MRFAIETYCTYSYPGFFVSDDTLLSIKIRNTDEQHPACAHLDELDDIHNYSWDHCRDDAPDRDVAEPIDVKELTGYVRRTLKIVNAITNLPWFDLYSEAPGRRQFSRLKDKINERYRIDPLRQTRR